MQSQEVSREKEMNSLLENHFYWYSLLYSLFNLNSSGVFMHGNIISTFT